MSFDCKGDLTYSRRRMSPTETVILGALAGFAIFLGLPLGRVRKANLRLKSALSSLATGILIFLLFDVLVHAVEPVEHALEEAVDGGRAWGEFVQLAATFALGTIVGLMSLVYYDRWVARERGRAMPGPGAASRAEFAGQGFGGLSSLQWLALLIAVGIGLHNFSEGLAIGQSAAQGAVSLALVLIIGFGLHNATEGFGIVAPLSGDAERPSWRFLALLGLIGGGPTFLGTVIGQSFVNDTVSVGFFALAAGSILYVVIELLAVLRRVDAKVLVTWAVLAGLFLGFATELVIEAAH